MRQAGPGRGVWRRAWPGQFRRLAGAALAAGLAAPSLGSAQQPASPADRAWVDPPAQTTPMPAAPADALPPATSPARPQTASPVPPPRPADATSSVTPSRPQTASPAPSRPAEGTASADPPRREPPPPAPVRVRPGHVPGLPQEAQRRAPRGDRLAHREGLAQALAVDYLEFWSAPNAVALETTPSFYAPVVFFHGREMSARALFEEKRRFVRRWPERRYRPRQNTMLVTCDPSGRLCTVRTVFDFTAASPDRGRRSQGSAVLQLGVSLAGDRPVIVSETSWVIGRGRPRGAAQFEDPAE